MMEAWNIQPTEQTYEYVVKRLVDNERLESCLQMLAQLGRENLTPTLHTASMVVTCAVNLGYSRLALDLAESFERTSVRRLDAEVWCDILAGCAQSLYVSLAPMITYAVLTYFQGRGDPASLEEGC